MSFCVCKILFKSEQICGCCCKMLRGSLFLGHTVLIWRCCGLQQQLVATWAEFQHRVVYYATEQCRERLEACINAEGGHSEHLL